VNPARVLLAAGTAVVLAALAVLGAVLPAVEGGRPDGVVLPAVAGGSVCPLGDTADGAALDLVLAAPGAAGAATATATDARATVVVLGDRPGRAAPAPLSPGAVAVVPVDVAAGGTTWVGWADAPVVAWREWRRPAAPGLPRGRGVGACVGAEATTWHVVGLRTDGGSEAVLRFANPYAVDATLAVTLVTTEGAVAPIALQNLSVPAAGTAELRVNDHVPERPDVAAIVRVTAGRAAVEGLQLALAGVGGVDGVALVPAATAPAPAWTLPWVPGGDGTATTAWAWVLNPSERDVELEVTVHGADGPELPPGAEAVVVPAGRLVRVDAAELVPAGADAVGVTLRSPTDPVVVGGGLVVDPGDPAGSGIAALPAVPAGDRGWLLAGRQGEDRTTTVRLVNVDAEDATVALELRAPGGAVRALPRVAVPAGAMRSVPVPVDPGAGWALEVVADGELVAAVTGRGSGAPEPVAAAGVPSAAWRSGGSGLVDVRRDGWTLTPAG